MPVTINASTSSGLVTTPDNSGTIALQSNGVTKATVSSSGFSYPGAVLQVVSYADPNQRSTSNGSFTASGMQVTFTPISSTSKMFVQVTTCCYKNTDGAGYLTIYRNGTNLAGSGNQLNMLNVADRYVPLSMSYLDTPATASALTYEVYYYRTGSANIYINSTNSGSTVGSITVMEVAA